MQCILCACRSDHRVCSRCSRRVDANLAVLPAAYTALGLPMLPMASQGAGPRVSGSKEPPLPVPVEVLSLRGPGGIIDWTYGWELYWRSERGFGKPQPVPVGQILAAAVKFLRMHMQWIGDYGGEEIVYSFADQLAVLLARTRAVTGTAYSDHMRIGFCPSDGCRGVLYASPWADHINCEACGADWPRTQWMSLAVTIREAVAA